MTTTTKKRGGPQPGSGRPKKDEAEKAIKCNITMTPAQHAATKGDRAGMIRRVLDGFLHSLENETTENKPPYEETNNTRHPKAKA